MNFVIVEMWELLATAGVCVAVGVSLGYAIGSKPVPSKGRPDDE